MVALKGILAFCIFTFTLPAFAFQPSANFALKFGHNRNIDNAPPAPDGSPTEAFDINPSAEGKLEWGKRKESLFLVSGKVDYEKYLKTTTDKTAYNLAFSVSPQIKHWWMNEWFTQLSTKFTRNLSGAGLGGATTNTNGQAKFYNNVKLNDETTAGVAVKYKRTYYSFSTKRNNAWTFSADVSNQVHSIVNLGGDLSYDMLRSNSATSEYHGAGASVIGIITPWDPVTIFTLANFARRFFKSATDNTFFLLASIEYLIFQNFAIALETSYIANYSADSSRRYNTLIPVLGLEYRL